jgi:phosphatidylinositol glycan class F
MPGPEPAFARRWRTKFNAALDRSSPSTTAQSQTFPLAQYTSLHLVLSAFLLFSFTALPRSQAWLDSVLGHEVAQQIGQKVSADRPEAEWLTRVTVDPGVTVAWSCAGLVVSLGWWSVHLRRWWVAQRVAENPDAKAQIEAEDTVTVCQILSLSLRRDRLTLSSVLQLVRNAALATIASTFLIAPLLILLGAPSTTHHVQTILLALHLSLLIVLPPAYALGIPSLYESGSFERFRLTRLFCELAYVPYLLITNTSIT